MEDTEQWSSSGQRSMASLVSVVYKCKKKLPFIHKLTASDTSKTAKITKR